ncbi:hypothetical protein PVAG01_00978 [Phlyctema vagabunda]|uniref:Uncharacterized protein n=1 Tax=Phlyctema vagabunda TaxID=108571 RepID=A0ABR4PVS7_9HELO
MALYGKSKSIETKEDLQNYQCQGYVTLHELFHLDSLSKVGSQGHVTDHRINYKRDYNGKYVYTIAYGLLFIRILAAWGGDLVGFYIGTNADSLAQYSLSKWVQKETGLYPRYPLRNGVIPSPGTEPHLVAFDQGVMVFNVSAMLPFVQGPLISTVENVSYACDDFASSTSGACLALDNFPVFISRFSEFLDQPEQTDPQSFGVGYHTTAYSPYQLPEDPNLECTGSKGINPLCILPIQFHVQFMFRSSNPCPFRRSVEERTKVLTLNPLRRMSRFVDPKR